MRGVERRETLGMIDRSSVLEQYDSDGANDANDSGSDAHSYHSDQNQFSKSYSQIEFCVKT